jgi:hypothetical protein
MQKKTQRPVQFEITEHTRDAVAHWITAAHLTPEQYLIAGPQGCHAECPKAGIHSHSLLSVTPAESKWFIRAYQYFHLDTKSV